MKCLLIDDMHDSIHALLEPLALDVNYKPTITKEELISCIGDYEIIFVRSKIFFDASIFDKAKKLKIIARAGAGVDNIDVSELTKRNIMLINAPEGNRDAVAEHTVGLILSLLNNFRKGQSEIEQGKWLREENRGTELSSLTVGILGYGYMGEAVSKRLYSFGCKIIAYDKYKKNFSSPFVEEVTEQFFYENTDILSVHIPLTVENKFLLTPDYFTQFKKKLYFINTARGELIKLKTIQHLLESKKFKGVGLDVLENEKMNQLSEEQQFYLNKLINRTDVILTPHVGGWTFESYRKINEVLVSKLKEIL